MEVGVAFDGEPITGLILSHPVLRWEPCQLSFLPLNILDARPLRRIRDESAGGLVFAPSGRGHLSLPLYTLLRSSPSGWALAFPPRDGSSPGRLIATFWY